MAKQSGSVKAQEWRQRFDRYRASGATVERFCNRERVTIAAFYYWRKVFGTTPTNDSVASVRHGDFAPVRLVNSASVTVHLSGGTRLEIPMADPESLEQAIRVLMREDARRADAQREEAGRC
jgi:hypothetical protein